MSYYTDPIHGGQIVPSFNIPEVFGDAISYEDKLIALANWTCARIKDAANDRANIKQTIQTINDAIAKLRQEHKTDIDDLRAMIEKLGQQQVEYNPTNGEYEDSQKVNRDMYRELAVHKATVAQLATLTVKEAAQYKCLETAVIGDLIIFHNEMPKVYPRKGTENA